MNINDSSVDPNDEDSEYHVIPNEDVLEHIHHYKCPCQPTKILAGVAYVFIHNDIKENLA